MSIKKCLFLTVISLCLGTIPSWGEMEYNKGKDNMTKVNIATFDSGFGGFFTAKAIEKSSHTILKNYNTQVKISHFGDTQNAPYGEKTPERIAELTVKGVLDALDRGADMTFIACNTASTQYSAVKKAVEDKYPSRSKDVISIIDASAKEVKENLDTRLTSSDEVHFAVLATPATIKSGIYPDSLAKLYGGSLQSEPLTPVKQERWFKESGQEIDSFTGKAVINLEDEKKIHIYQIAPANWVDLIEKEGSLADKNYAVKRDIELLEKLLPEGVKLDGVGEFCTHYPVFDNMIQVRLQETEKTTKDAFFIKQGPLMAEIFEKRMETYLESQKRSRPLTDASKELKKLYELARPDITISGDNVAPTKRLARTIFPHDPEPSVKQVEVGNQQKEIIAPKEKIN